MKILKQILNTEEIYFGDTLLINDDFYEPIKVGNRIIGYFKNGTFNQISADHLNSMQFDETGAANLNTPFGERETRTEASNIVDFTLKGFDQDLGAVRMGHRFYDPVAKRFLTPDMYMIENPDKILESPVEGNLYSYAGNDPLLNVDPSGDDSKVFISGTPSSELSRGSRNGQYYSYPTYEAKVYNNTEKWYNKVLDAMGLRLPDKTFQVGRDADHPSGSRGPAPAGQGTLSINNKGERSLSQRYGSEKWITFTGVGQNWGEYKNRTGINAHPGGTLNSQGCITFGGNYADPKDYNSFYNSLKTDLEKNKPVTFEIEPMAR